MSYQDEAIDALNTIVKVRLAPSKIHGVGVFAMFDIPKGTRLHADMFPTPFTIPYGSFKKLFPPIRELILEHFPQVVNGSKFMYPDTFIQAHMNHSTNPNYNAQTDTTLEDIKVGDEVLEDYRLIPNCGKVFPFLTKEKVV